MDEQWKIHPTYPNYRISNQGRVESCFSGVWKPIKLLKLKRGKSRAPRYLMFTISLGGKKFIRAKVHHVVAELFIGPKPPGLWVLHKDDDPSNNVWTNLYYGTYLDNERDRLRNS